MAALLPGHPLGRGASLHYKVLVTLKSASLQLVQENNEPLVNAANEVNISR